MLAARIIAAAMAASSAIAAVQPGLFGVGTAQGGNYVLQSYAADGTVTPVGSPLPGELIAQELSDIDQVNAIYYYIGYNTATNNSELVGLSLADGSVLHRTPLPFYCTEVVGVGQMLAAGLPDGSVIVGGLLSPTSGHSMGTLNPRTGRYIQRASFSPTLGSVVAGITSYSPKSNRVLIQLQAGEDVDWYWLDLSTNKTGTYTDPNCDDLQTLDWDASRDAFIGIGLYVNNTRNVGIMDAVSGKCSVLGQFSGYLVIEGGQGAYDASTGTLWSILQPTQGGPEAPYDLVAVSTKGQVKVVSSHVLEACPDPNNCPWQLEYYYGSA